MGVLPFLIGWPVLIALIVPFLKSERARSAVVYVGAGGVMALAGALLAQWLLSGGVVMSFYEETELVDHLMLAGELVLMALIVFLSFKFRKYPVALLSVAQTAVLIWTETAFPVDPASHMKVDGLSMLLTVIAAFVGGFICIYAVGYMKAYHHHHTEYKDRTGFFLSMLFLFLGAMFGLVLSGNLVWMYFFWEITSVVSFLLIGYTRTEEAVHNSFRALWMNLLGGLGFAVARLRCWRSPASQSRRSCRSPRGCSARWSPRRLRAPCCTAPRWSRRASTCSSAFRPRWRGRWGARWFRSSAALRSSRAA